MNSPDARTPCSQHSRDMVARLGPERKCNVVMAAPPPTRIGNWRGVGQVPAGEQLGEGVSDAYSERKI